MKLRQILSTYLTYYPNDCETLSLLMGQVKAQTDAELKSRKNYLGHFTTSSFLICQDTKRVLLVEHKILGEMFQPGGHIEASDANTLDSALRELREETGVNLKALNYKCLISDQVLIPFNIELQLIPANHKKHEDSHCHYDMHYLFFIDKEPVIDIDYVESNNYQWVEWGDFIKMPRFIKVAEKVNLVDNWCCL